MILDEQGLFSNAQAITATAVSTNHIDLGAPGTPFGAANPLERDIGKGIAPEILVQVGVNFLTLTSLTVNIEVDDNAAFSSAKVVGTSGAIAVADLVAGYQFPVKISRGTNERYMRLNYVVGGASATAGNVTAGISAGNQDNV